MYKVLVVDDERTIREGIVKMVDWKSLDLEVIGVKQNGLEALDFINHFHPEIVLTDIKMPEMDGLELIAQVQQGENGVKFIVLSGYGEFELASKAMSYGVKHYILKPCDELDISRALKKIVEELRQRDKKELLLQKADEYWQQALPQMKERFLIDAIETGKYNHNDFERLKEMFQLSDQWFRLILLRLGNDSMLLERFALKNIAEEVLASYHVQISTMFKGDILLLIDSDEYANLEEPLEDIQFVFSHYYNKKISIAISDENAFMHLQAMYEDVSECMQYAFYIGEGHLITRDEVRLESEISEGDWKEDLEKITEFIKTGHRGALKGQLESFFNRLARSKFRIELTRVYCIELLLNIIRQCKKEDLENISNNIGLIENMNTLQYIQTYITDFAMDISIQNFEETKMRYSKVVGKVVSVIEEQLANPDLSLKKIAREVLFMNEDYLGRLFQRETGERFSQFLNRQRMEKAKRLLESDSDLKIFEVSDKVGFGESSRHYFSLAFKKYSGMSPSEYKSSCDNSGGSNK